MFSDDEYSSESDDEVGRALISVSTATEKREEESVDE